MTSRTGVGRFFAWGGIALAFVGFVVLVGGLAAGGGDLGLGGAITGMVFLMIGVIWAAVGFGVGSYYRGIARRAAAEKQLFETGERATAVVEGATVSATQINDNPVIELALRVKPRDGREFVHTRRLAVPPNGIPLPGQLVEVAFDPRDRSKVAIETAARFAAPPARYIKTRPAEAAPASAAAPAAEPAEDRLDKLERLQKLREAGALTESEFAAQKARILLE